MKRKYILLMLSLLHSALCFSAVPKWIVNKEKEFPSAKYISGLGKGNSESLAKQMALSELSTYFNVSTESKIYAHDSKTQNNSKYSTESSIAKDIITLSKAELFALHYTQSYYDEKEKNYSVCAYIDKEEFSNISKEKIASFKFTYADQIMFAETESDNLRKILIMNGALYNADNVIKLHEYLKFIDSKLAQYFNDDISQIIKSKNTLFQLKQKNPISVFSSGDYSEQIKNIISEILTENGFVISKNADYKINANTTCIISTQITKQHEIFSTTPTVSVFLEDNSGTISSCVFSSEKIASYNNQTLTGMALSALEDLLRDKLSLELLRLRGII